MNLPAKCKRSVYMAYNQSMVNTGIHHRVYTIVRQIPRGKVATYGQIARIVGGISAQMVGFALAALPVHPEESAVPWQRVVNVRGHVSPHGAGFGSARQRLLLEEEGIAFNLEDQIDLSIYGW